MLLVIFLSFIQIYLGGEQLNVEIAKSPSSQEKGLMGREKLENNEGMLFVYPEEKILSFWMKNTKIPLSIAFFDKDKVLFQKIDMPPPPKGAIHFPIYRSFKPAQYALEVPQGWFESSSIAEGMKFSFPDPPN